MTTLVFKQKEDERYLTIGPCMDRICSELEVLWFSYNIKIAILDSGVLFDSDDFKVNGITKIKKIYDLSDTSLIYVHERIIGKVKYYTGTIKEVDYIKIPSSCLNRLIAKNPNVSDWNITDILEIKNSEGD